MNKEEKRLRHNELARLWREKYPERVKAIYKKYYCKNHKKVTEQKRNRLRMLYIKDPKKINFRNALWRENNPEKTSLINKRASKKWRKKNPHNFKRKYDSNPNFRILSLLRTRLWFALKDNRKSKRTTELLGCSVEFLRQYLESKFVRGMTWDNAGKWHVDHIKPCSSFNLGTIKEQNKCFHYTNLQPMWGVENLKKGSKIFPMEL